MGAKAQSDPGDRCYRRGLWCFASGGALIVALLYQQGRRRWILERKMVRQEDVSRTPRRWRIACADENASRCGKRSCDRIVIDDWLGEEDVDALLSIASRGAAAVRAPAEEGGPTIFDANSGYVMAPGARLANIYAVEAKAATSTLSIDDFELYRRAIRLLKSEVEAAFHREGPLYFTAPTFIARLSGKNRSWVPSSPHDEYWHPHVDKHNTHHYEYSGLLYLSDWGIDFEGGAFEFFEIGTNRTALTIQPRRGRLLLFSSADENRHCVRRVTGGVRFALSFWFTCDPRFEFADFLDGKMHLRFREK